MNFVNREELIGRRFGTLMVFAFAWMANTNSHWRCKCVCGAKLVVNRPNLVTGHTQSCGCTRGTHGMYKSREYRTWQSMIQRCTNKNSEEYGNYGGRGIKVCTPWKSFENFYADMGKRPAKLSLERKNNSENYTKRNCIWATRKEQNRNKRTNVLLTLFGKTQCIADWAAEYGFHRSLIGSRLRMGWSLEKAITTPIIAKTAKRSRRSEEKDWV